MTLWHLLIGVSSLAPFFGALAAGKEGNLFGITVSVLIGLVCCLFNFCGLNWISWFVLHKVDNMKPFIGELTTAAFYVAVLVWGFFTTALIIQLLRLVLSLK